MEDDAILKQALDVVESAEREAPLSPAPIADVVGLARTMLSALFGDPWKTAEYTHYHTAAGNCLVVAVQVEARLFGKPVVTSMLVEIAPPDGLIILSQVVK